MVSVVLFDFDGTLADSFPSFLEIVAKLSEKHKFKNLTPVELEKLRGENVKSILKILSIPIYKLPFLARDMKSLQSQSIETIKPFPEIPQTLKKLKEKDVALGILTSNSPDNVNKFLRKNGLNYFDYIIGDIGIFGKSGSLKDFIKKQKLGKEDVLYVGDEIRDIQACRRAGIKIAAVAWGFGSEVGLKKYDPDFLIRTPDELLPLLES